VVPVASPLVAGPRALEPGGEGARRRLLEAVREPGRPAGHTHTEYVIRPSMEPGHVGLRDKKAARTREAISRTAIGMFCERGFDAVTMTEIAAAAQVGRATLFAYYPTKDALVLDRISDDDPCRVVASRADGVTLVEALRSHYQASAGEFDPAQQEGTKLIMELITSTPALMAGMARSFDKQRDDLADLLAKEDPGDARGLTARVVAAQAVGVILMLKSSFYQRLVTEPAEVAVAQHVVEVYDAFELLAAGVGDRYRKAAA